MALDFLNNALGAGMVGAGIAGLFGGGGGERPIQEGDYKWAVQNQKKISKMLQDPSHPDFQRLVGQEEGNLRGDFQQGINELLIRNRRAQARGTTGAMINPERQDEGVAAATAETFERAREQARNNARSYLMSASSVNNSMMGMPQQMDMGPFRTAAGLESIFMGLGAMNQGGMQNGGNAPSNLNISLNPGNMYGGMGGNRAYPWYGPK